MKKEPKNSKFHGEEEKYSLLEKREFLEKIQGKSGKEVLDTIFNEDKPRDLIANIPSQDFFWLIKKNEIEENLALLEMASDEQLQYLLDIELWRKDRLDDDGISLWLKWLYMSDRQRLAKWLFGEGQWLSFLYFYRNLHVLIWDKEDNPDFPEEYTSFDGVYYFKILSKENEDIIKNILKELASENPDRYESLLIGLSGVLPAELEEEMYRQRNVRIAEHGFLPREEAIMVYSPLKPEKLHMDKKHEDIIQLNEENLKMVPILPSFHAGRENFLGDVTSRIDDNALAERLRLEFAGLCNQTLSADGLSDITFETLAETCKRNAGYLSLALEKNCGRDTNIAKKLLENNSLISIFRAGYEMAMELKRETEKWLKSCWFFKNEIDFSFWGDYWEEVLSAILQDKPQMYAGFEFSEGYSDFSAVSDLESTRKNLLYIKALDNLLGKIFEIYDEKDSVLVSEDLTIDSLIITLWARKVLEMEPPLEGMELEDIRKFFILLRGEEDSPPYEMKRFRGRFISDFKGIASHMSHQEKKHLITAITFIWNRFKEEYQWVPTDKIDVKHLIFFRIKPV